MKSLHVLKLYFAIFCCFNLQAQDVLWDKSYGGKHSDYLFDVQPTADYGFILAGSSLSQKSGTKTNNNEGDLDYWVWKMNEDGDLDWQKNFGGSGADFLNSIRNTSDGGFILGGTSESGVGIHKRDSCRGHEDFWIIKLNAKGNEEWQRTLGGSGRDLAKTILQTPDGGYIIGGTSDSGISLKILEGGVDKNGKSEKSRGNTDYWIVKLDEKGEIKWQKTFGGQYADILESLILTKDGGYLIGGYSNSPASQDKAHDGYGEGDFWVIKIDKDGEIEWQQILGGSEDDHLYSVIQTNDGNYIIGGDSSSRSSGNKSKVSKKGSDFWILKLDERGNILWQETYDTGKADILTSVIENRDGTILLGGYAQSETIGTAKKDKKEINDYIALKISAEGEQLWKETVGSNGEDVLRKVIETRDGGYVLAGTSKGEISRDRNSSQGREDFWVVKLKDKDKKKEERKLNIEAIPNPAPEFTNIIVGFEFTRGTLTIYDLTGRQLQMFTVTDRTIPIDLGRYPEGIYVVEVRTDKGDESVKVMKGSN